jgi:hypothetical protein
MRSFIICTFAKYYEDNQLKDGEMAGHVGRMGQIRSAYKILDGKQRIGTTWET